MSLPENNSRLYVGGIPVGTGDADLRRHFLQYGEVTDICLPRDRFTGSTRGFAFVQFSRASDADRALADQHQVINGLQVRIARAEPRHKERAGCHRGTPGYKPLSQRVYVVNKWRYRVGDKLRISFGPLGENYEECEYVNRVRGFGCIIDNKLIFDCLIGYISEDGKECLIRWPPEKQSDCETGYSGQGSIRQSCGSLKDFVEFSSSTNVVGSDGQSQTWCWILT